MPGLVAPQWDTGYRDITKFRVSQARLPVPASDSAHTCVHLLQLQPLHNADSISGKATSLIQTSCSGPAAPLGNPQTRENRGPILPSLLGHPGSGIA